MGEIRETYHKLMQLLNEVSEAEDSAGRGMLSAVVVGARSGMPGRGYFSLARRLGREGAGRQSGGTNVDSFRRPGRIEHSSHRARATAR